MKIQNKGFNNWIKSRGYEYDPISDDYYKMSIIDKPELLRNTELIGLMTIYLLDTEEWSICKGNKYYSIQDGYEEAYENTDLFTALKEAIEGMQE